MSEAVSKIKSNFRDRVDEVKRFITNEKVTIKAGVSEIIGLKPVQGLCTLVFESLNNVGALVKKQAEITRRWIERI